MNSHREPEGSRPSTRIAIDIVNGKPWTARTIRNNNLRQHCSLLARTFRPKQELTDQLKPSFLKLIKAISDETDFLTEVHPAEFSIIPALVRIAAYADRWIREPETWNAETSISPVQQFRSLLHHLFARWPMPEFFDSAWLVKGDLIYLERDWYCHFASGGSLRKARGMPPSVTSRALHLAMSAPANLTIRQALRWGQAKAADASDALLTEIISSRMVADLSNDAIWSRLIEKAAACANFRAEDFGIIADTLIGCLAIGRFHRAAALLDLPMPVLLRHCHHFWTTLLKTTVDNEIDFKRSNIHCPHLRRELHQLNFTAYLPMLDGHPFSLRQDCNLFGHEIRLGWKIEELTHQYQFIAEGQAMKHCLASYWKYCKNGKSAIFSLRTYRQAGDRITMDRHLTIEVDRESRKVIQVRGKHNRWINPRNVPPLQSWANRFNLIL